MGSETKWSEASEQECREFLAQFQPQTFSCIWHLAFWARDLCEERSIGGAWDNIVHQQSGHYLRWASPLDWVRAACAALDKENLCQP